MKCKEIINILEELAPVGYAEEWDNVGLLVGDREKEIKHIMVALDATESVVMQARTNHIDMLITHHPLIFSPMDKIINDNFIGKRIVQLIRGDISYYAMHTNFDIAVMATEAANRLKLSKVRVLQPIDNDKTIGIGRYGYLEQNLTLEQCARLVKERFELDFVRMIGDSTKIVSLVAVSPGSGKNYIKDAIKAGVDVLITGDIDHHAALDAKEQGLSIIDGGHFGTEHPMVEYMIHYLEKHFHMLGLNSITIQAAKEESPFALV